MKVLCGKRNLFFFVPREGGFQTGFVFGEKAIEEVMRSGLPERLKKELRESRKYAEGRGLRVEVRFPADVETVEGLWPASRTGTDRSVPGRSARGRTSRGRSVRA